MTDYKFYIKYRVNGTLYGTSKEKCVHYTLDKEYSDNRIKVIIKPKENVKIELVEVKLSFIRNFVDDDRFFANGFQSWTTSREYSKNDKNKRINQLYKAIDLISAYAGSPGDYLFTEEEKKAGCFHSWTYTYIRNGEKVELLGSLSDRFAYTLFKVDMQGGTIDINKDVSGKTISEEVTLFDIVRFVGDYDKVFDEYFDSMHIRKPRIDHMSGYTSWYNYFANIDEDIIIRDLNGLDRVSDSVNIIQIDDGYQVATGDWVENEKFSHGLKAITESIHDKGYLAGLWLAPFSVNKQSSMFKEHKDWLITNDKGKPMLNAMSWGGGYSMDIYIPEVREYIKSFFKRVFDEWNFDMVKLDFLYSQAIMPRNNKTRSEIMYDAMDFLRECVGDKILLACGAPLAPCFGVTDACRISCDVDIKYSDTLFRMLKFNKETPSAINALTSTIFRRHLNGRAFVNDPDVFFLRDVNIKFTEDQKLLLGFINNLLGDVLFVSDNAGDFSEQKIDILKTFFEKNSNKVLKAEYIDKYNMQIDFTDNESVKSIKFNIKTGESNVRDLLGL